MGWSTTALHEQQRGSTQSPKGEVLVAPSVALDTVHMTPFSASFIQEMMLGLAPSFNQGAFNTHGP